MSEVYKDPFQEYKAALDLTKKKFMKKPNYPMALVQLEKLSLRFQDEDCEKFSAMCYIQIAKIHECLNSWSIQYSSWLKAARALKVAEKRNQEMSIIACSDHLNNMQYCYAHAIKLALDHSGVWLAGLHCTELGNTLCEFGYHQEALRHLSQGVDLLKIEFRSRIVALKMLAACQIELSLYTEALETVDDLWTTHMKNSSNPKFGYGKELLVTCETATVLLLLLRKSDDISGRHRLLLSMYEENLFMKNADALSRDELAWKNIPPEESALSREIYMCFYDFIMMLQMGKIIKAEKGYNCLSKILSEMCLRLASNLLVDVVKNGPLSYRGFAYRHC